MLNLVKYFILATFFLFSFANTALAVIPPPPFPGGDGDLGKIEPPAGIPSLENFVTAAIRLVIIVAFLAALIFLLIGAIQWIVAGGEPKATAAARSRVTAALVGLAIVVSSFVIIKLIEFFFNVTVISGGKIPIPVP